MNNLAFRNVFSKRGSHTAVVIGQIVSMLAQDQSRILGLPLHKVELEKWSRIMCRFLLCYDADVVKLQVICRTYILGNDYLLTLLRMHAGFVY